MKNQDSLYNLLPGLCQGITRVTISYPFDVIKVNMQKNVFNSTKEAIINIFKNDPWRFYRGSTFSYISVSLERSLQFYYMEKLNTYNNNPFLNGFCLSLVSSLYNVPAQYLTTNIALNNIGTLKYLKNVFKNNTNIYKGSGLEIIRNSINSTIFMGTYYTLRNNYGDTSYITPLYGAISGTMCWLITFPLDTIRTDYQSSDKNIKTLITNRFKQQGFIGFYRGITPVLIRTVPSSSIGMYVYEKIKKILQ
jgi:hypothetical protein